jgi:hypothetical protein
MQASLLRELVSRRFAIRARWEALLRAEPVTTPLGMPDTLVHLINLTLEEILAVLAESLRPRQPEARDTATEERPVCPCGRNPLLAYFAAAEQAMREGLILAQAASAPLDPVERDASLKELNTVLQNISRREIEAFCGVCQFREASERAPLLLMEAHS